jgi:hypothetical protein
MSFLLAHAKCVKLSQISLPLLAAVRYSCSKVLRELQTKSFPRASYKIYVHSPGRFRKATCSSHAALDKQLQTTVRGIRENWKN